MKNVLFGYKADFTLAMIAICLQIEAGKATEEIQVYMASLRLANSPSSSISTTLRWA